MKCGNCLRSNTAITVLLSITRSQIFTIYGSEAEKSDGSKKSLTLGDLRRNIQVNAVGITLRSDRTFASVSWLERPE